MARRWYDFLEHSISFLVSWRSMADLCVPDREIVGGGGGAAVTAAPGGMRL
jgi:hypothetical protein